MIWDADDIKALRKRHQLTQPMLAKLVGVTLKNVYCWEQGQYLPNAIHQEALSLLAAGKQA